MSTNEIREQFIAAITSPAFSHVSIRRWCGLQAFVYHRDESSPTGVLCVAGLPEAEADPILREHGRTAHFGPQRGDMSTSHSQTTG